MSLTNLILKKRNAYIDNFPFNSIGEFYFDVLHFLDRNTPDYWNKKALLFFYKNDLNKALECFLNALKIDLGDRNTIRNLGYISSNFLDAEQINALFLNISKFSYNKEWSVYLLKLYCSLYLGVDFESAKKYVDKEYIEKYINPNIKEFPKKNIYFYHVPKCSGTSLSTALISKYYRINTGFLPDYTSHKLLKYCVEEKMYHFPFLRSQHTNFDDISPKDTDVFTFTILRDPVRRLISMYRQSVSSYGKGDKNLKLIQKYGSNWDYWTATSLNSWLDSVPDDMILKQIRTFSKGMNKLEARDVIKSLDYNLIYDYGQGSMQELLNSMRSGLNANDLPTNLNKSPRNIKISDDQETYLRNLLSEEYDLIRLLLQ